MMKNDMKEDIVKRLDFKSAFPVTPSIIHDAVMKAQADIERYERRRRFIKSTITAVAACFLVVAGAAVFFMRSGGGNSDLIVPPVLSGNDVVIDMETPVFACKTDPYYHSRIDCDSAYAESVELPLVTAIEFEKMACPACAHNLETEDTKAFSTKMGQGNNHEAKSLKPVAYNSDGAADDYKKCVDSGETPVLEAEFFGGILKVYGLQDGTYVAGTDPTPDDEVFRYVLIGRKEINAEDYYRINGGPGVYADYDEKEKCLTATWGDDYYTHIYYTASIETNVISENGECTWRMTQEQYNTFVDEKTLTMSQNRVEFQPALSASFMQ